MIVGTKYWYGIAINNRNFVAVGQAGWITNSTDNGETWATPKQIGTTDWKGVAYGNGLFVANNYWSDFITSTDGFTWTEPIKMKDESGKDVNVIITAIVPMP